MLTESLPDNSLDHVVLVTPDVALTSSWIEQMTGVTPSKGGSHLGRGTFNTLCSFGPGGYLEIIGPDPDQPEPVEPRPFGIDDLTEQGIVGWCVRRQGRDELATRGSEFEAQFIGPLSMSRDAPEGLLEWTMLFCSADLPFGLVPFFIDWGSTPHPSRTAAAGLELKTLKAAHAEPQRVLRIMLALDLTLEVCEGPQTGLTAVLAGPEGTLTVPPAAFDR